MKNYWACSKFADWLRGTTKPFSGTSEEWNAWEKKAKEKKFRYWLAEEGLDHLQNFICWPENRINEIRCYINNRWVKKSHALTSNLKRGNWYDFDTRLLHDVFDELINFVEVELAWKLVICSDEDRKKYKFPWYRSFFRIGVWRNHEAGMAYLKWASELKADENWIDKNDSSYGQPSYQALAAQETLKLYKWWKEVRPKRPDPGDVSGWNKYYEEESSKAKASGDDSGYDYILNKKRNEGSHEILNLYDKIEKEQEEEDTNMLIRLVKLRHSLWS